MPLNGTIRPRSQRYRPTPLKRDHQMSKSQTATDTIVGDDQRNTHSRRTVLRGLAATGSAAFAWNTISGSASAIEPSQQVRSDGPLSDPDSFETFLNGVLNAQLEAHDIPGATVAVVDGDSTFTKGYGVRDVRTDAPVEADDTLFRIGSTSKLFTWTAVMQGIEAGRLDLETDVNEYLDDITIPDTYDQPITLDHLVTHTAGFEERARGTFVLSEADLRPLSTMIRNERPARVRPPGAFTAYSNYGAALAGHIAATTAGSSFSEYVDTEIFEPLGMDRSTFDQPVPDVIDGTLSKGYTTQNGRYREGDFEYVGMAPAGSMTTTAADMVRFIRAHLQDGAIAEGRILKADSTATMHQRRFGNDDRLNGMCFGFYGFESEQRAYRGARRRYRAVPQPASRASGARCRPLRLVQQPRRYRRQRRTARRTDRRVLSERGDDTSAQW